MKNIKAYEEVSNDSSRMNESIDLDKVQECIELLGDAKSQMDDALANLNSVYRMLQGTELSTTAERLKGYIIGHLEPMISSDHGWMTRSVSIDEIIKDLEESGFDNDSLEEE
jgi:hypothetical protein